MGTYLIIGGSSGIGAEITKGLAAEKHNVYATFNRSFDVSPKENTYYSHLNVLDPSIQFDFLPAELDGLVYCPGSINLMPFKRIKAEDLIEDFELQVVGAVKVIQAVLPRLKKAAAPSIVLFSSVAAQNGFNFHAQVAASKGAIEGVTKALSAEFAPTIRVNAIAPSLTQTPLSERLLNTTSKIEANAERHPLKRIGQPADIAETARFLLSNKASWITGQIIGVDGGISAIK